MFYFRENFVHSNELYPISNDRDSGLFFEIPGFIGQEINNSLTLNGYLDDFFNFFNNLPNNPKIFWLPGLSSARKSYLKKSIEAWDKCDQSKYRDFFDFLVPYADINEIYFLYLSDKVGCDIIGFEIEHSGIDLISYHYVFDKDNKLRDMNDEEFVSFLNRAILYMRK